MRKIIIVLLFICIFLITACQPTPEKIINNKTNLIDTVDQNNKTADESTEQNDGDSIHVSWQKSDVVEDNSFLNKTVTINVVVDADTDPIPDIIPLTEVTPATFDISFIKKTVNYFMDSEFYDGSIRTKDDKLMNILELKRFIAANESEATNGQLNDMNDLLKQLEEEYDKAPEYNEKGVIEFSNDGQGNSVLLKGYPDDNCISELNAINDGKKNTTFYYITVNPTIEYVESDIPYLESPTNVIQVSFEEAKEIADNVIYSLTDISFSLIDTKLLSGSNPYAYTINDDTIEEQCYAFYYTRDFDGIKTLYVSNAVSVDLESDQITENYSEPWPPEYIKILVDDTGLIEFWWFSPSKVVQILSEDLDIISFEEAFEIFKKNIFYSSVWAGGLCENVDINIERIEFGLVRIPVEDDINRYIMVPAWSFLGSKYEDSEIIQVDKSFMVVNAINGSIIDPAKGY